MLMGGIMETKQYKCVLCNNHQEKEFDRLGFEYFRCKECGLVSTYPFPDHAAIEDHYKRKFEEGNYQLIQKYMKNYLNIYIGFTKLLKKHLKRKNQQIAGKKVLDIGCFTGNFLRILKDQGADVYGLELQAEAVQIANQSLNGRVYKADLLKNDFPQIEYDVITMLGLIEHVTDPIAFIKRAVALLKNDGLLMIQTPDSASWLARISGKHWPPYAPIEHIHLFSKKSLRNVLRDLGFTQIKFYRHVKFLPVDYVYQNLRNFGPEFHRFFGGTYKLTPNFIKQLSLPFYAGEIVTVASREGNGQ
jgi:2-polyprenyl-3-methyl-5-hydroxy-6-metoxy-1,4-benzoquinol methylase